MTEEVRTPTEEELRAMYNRGYSKQRLKDIGLIGLGTAVGGGLGWFAGDSLAQKAMTHPRLASALRYGVPVASALTAGYVGHLDSRRRELEAERAHLAGLLAQKKGREPQPVQEKIAGKNWGNFKDAVTTSEVWKRPFKDEEPEKTADINAPQGGADGRDLSPFGSAEIRRRQPDASKQLSSYPGALLGLVAGSLLGTAGGLRAAKGLPKGHSLKWSAPLVGGGVLGLLGGHLGAKGDLKRLSQRVPEGVDVEMITDPKELARYGLPEPEGGGDYRIHKTARILASPAEWTDTEKQTGIGAVVGGLGGLAAGGLTSTNPTFVKFALPGAVLGSFIARRRAKKLRQEQGYV